MFHVKHPRRESDQQQSAVRGKGQKQRAVPGVKLPAGQQIPHHRRGPGQHQGDGFVGGIDHRHDPLLRQAAELARAEDARLLVLDEVIDALRGFLPQEELCAFLDERPAGLEVVLTGHSLPEALERRADYITHMVKEKHPYDRGVTARREIEF